MKLFLALTTLVLIGGINCQTISDKLTELGCTTLLGALNQQNLTDTLEGLAGVTLFAPTDDALAAADLPSGANLTDLLTFHAINSSVGSADITDELQVASVNGASIRFNIYNNASTYTAQGAPIDLTQVDQAVVNGFIHVLDAVMFPPSQNIYEIVSSDPNFSTLKAAVEAAGLVDIISGTGPLTIFAPDNDAFAGVPSDVLEDLLANPEALADVLTSHAVADTYFSAGLNNGDSLPSVQGSNMAIVINPNGVFITSPEYSQVTTADVSATNGVIHVINRVLNLPVNNTVSDDISKTLADLDCTVLADVLSSTTSGGQTLMERLEGLSEVTLFAPTNAALEAAGELPSGDNLVNILNFHAVATPAPSSAIVDELLLESVNGTNIRFNIYDDSTLYTAQGVPINLNYIDVAVTNGIIHVLDAVMFPPSETVYGLVSNDPSFSTLKTAIDTADLDGLLNGEGNFTVFAPNNDAFANVPEDVLNNLLADVPALTDVLLYHAAQDTVFSAALDNNDVITTAQGDQIKIIINDNGVFINETTYAQVTGTDVSVTNGVVHVVNRVLKVVTNAEVDGATSVSTHTSLMLACLSLFLMFLKL